VPTFRKAEKQRKTGSYFKEALKDGQTLSYADLKTLVVMNTSKSPKTVERYIKEATTADYYKESIRTILLSSR
jgi:hypothetical protein